MDGAQVAAAAAAAALDEMERASRAAFEECVAKLREAISAKTACIAADEQWKIESLRVEHAVATAKVAADAARFADASAALEEATKTEEAAAECLEAARKNKARAAAAVAECRNVWTQSARDLHRVGEDARETEKKAAKRTRTRVEDAERQRKRYSIIPKDAQLHAGLGKLISEEASHKFGHASESD